MTQLEPYLVRKLLLPPMLLLLLLLLPLLLSLLLSLSFSLCLLPLCLLPLLLSLCSLALQLGSGSGDRITQLWLLPCWQHTISPDSSIVTRHDRARGNQF